MLSTFRILYLSFSITLLTIAIFSTDVQEALSDQPEQLRNMLQFKSSGHVLGFQKNGVYVAAGTHMLRESFVEARETIPQASESFNPSSQTEFLGTVTYSGLWKGITVIYDSPAGDILRSTYQIGPWGNSDQIALCYNVPIRLDIAGNLVFNFDTGAITASAPVAWQVIKEDRVPVEVSFNIDSSRSIVRFSLGYYNPAISLFIDPTLKWNTFVGSSDTDYGNAITMDGNGNIYVAGYSHAEWGSPVNEHAGNEDAFAAKLDSNGTLLWNTFMGSSNDDAGRAIAVDENGNVLVTGGSEATWGSPVNAYTGSLDAFVAKLNNNGETIWTTFMGSTSVDRGKAIAVDENGNVYVSGYSFATWGSPVNEFAGINPGFVAKLTSSGTLHWHMFLGSTTNVDESYTIDADGKGNACVAGYSWATWGSPLNDHAGDRDAFVAKISTGAMAPVIPMLLMGF